jgi:hypothetical protein
MLFLRHAFEVDATFRDSMNARGIGEPLNVLAIQSCAAS